MEQLCAGCAGDCAREKRSTESGVHRLRSVTRALYLIGTRDALCSMAGTPPISNFPSQEVCESLSRSERRNSSGKTIKVHNTSIMKVTERRLRFVQITQMELCRQIVCDVMFCKRIPNG